MKIKIKTQNTMNTRHKIYKLSKSISLIFLLLCTSVVMAQNEEEAYNEKVVVISGYQPVLQKSEKINYRPKITDTTNMMPNFHYDINPQRIYSLFSPQEIQAARLVGEPMAKLYKSYVKLGLGNYLTPMADIYFNSTRNKAWNYSARLFHNSSWWSLEDYGSNWFSNTGIDLFGKYIWENKVLSANVFYNHDYNLYYGFTDSVLNTIYPAITRDDMEKSDYSQHYNYVGAKVNFGTTNTNIEKLFYATQLGFYNLSDHYGSNELNVNFNGGIRYAFAWFGGNDKEILGLEFDWNLYSNKFDSLYPYSYVGNINMSDSADVENIFKIHPYIGLKLFGFDLNAGMNMFVTTSDKFKMAPYIVLYQNFLKGMLSVRLGAIGDMYRSSWQNIRMENPYVAPHCEVANTNYNKYFLETEIAVMNNLDLAFGASYKTLKNAPMFMIDTEYLLHNVYKPVYADYNELQVGANAKYRFANTNAILENTEISVAGNYYHYSTLDNFVYEHLLYKPSFDVNLGASYAYRDKVLVSLNTVLLGKMWGMDFDGTTQVYEQIPMKYGVDLKVEYKHNKALSFFATFDNVAFQRYFYWNNYPSQKFKFMLGLTYTVPAL